MLCGDKHGTNYMQKSDNAWKTAARMAALAEETDDDYEREHFTRLRNAWITLANRCEPFDLPDVTETSSSHHSCWEPVATRA